MPTPLVIAHRGDSSATLENSRAAVQRACSLSVDMIEIDIRMSRDKQLYVFHDAATGRTADKNIAIEQSSSPEISTVRLKNGESIPQLKDILSLVDNKCGLNLDIKSIGAGAETARQIIANGFSGTILLSSFKEEELTAARQILPSLTPAMIFNVFYGWDAPWYKARGYSIISLRKETVEKKVIDACHAEGIRIYVWTVDDEKTMKRLLAWGVDGIFSNRPALLKEVVNAFKNRYRENSIFRG
ncbi:MAG: glycerophosphodiester phosphodiesterase [Nitrospirota bacterium]